MGRTVIHKHSQQKFIATNSPKTSFSLCCNVRQGDLYLMKRLVTGDVSLRVVQIDKLIKVDQH